MCYSGNDLSRVKTGFVLPLCSLKGPQHSYFDTSFSRVVYTYYAELFFIVKLLCNENE